MRYGELSGHLHFVCPQRLPHRVDCDFVAGCDGARGVSRGHLTAKGRLLASHDYGIGWLALLMETPPSANGVIFGIHPRGFANFATPYRKGSFSPSPEGDSCSR